MDTHAAPQPTARVLEEIRAGLGLPAQKLARRLGTHPSTVLRWLSDGTDAPGGGRVWLEAVQVGRRWFTSEPAFDRFVVATSPAAPAPLPSSHPIPAGRHRRAAAAARQLEADGW
jgi:hypothetical protein